MKLKCGVIMERLPVLVTGPKIHDRLLGSPALPDGIGGGARSGAFVKRMGYLIHDTGCLHSIFLYRKEE